MSNVRETQVLVIGAGPGGYPAALHAADHGLKVTMVDEGEKLGGVCLNRGCIPSKALLHVAKVIREAHEAADIGLAFSEPKLDLDKLRNFVQAKVVGKLTGGIAQLCKGRGVETVLGRAEFIDANTVKVTGANPCTIKFQHCIIATGSLPAIPKTFTIDDPRVMDSTGALLLPDVPKKLLVVGGGYIGLEIGSVYAALGTKVTGRRIHGRNFANGGSRSGAAAGSEAQNRVRSDLPQHEGGEHRGDEGRDRGDARRQGRAAGTDLRPRADLDRPPARTALVLALPMPT